MTTNDAAERLRDAIWEMKNAKPFTMDQLLDAALAAERRTTVERIIQRLEDDYGWNPAHEVCRAILDAEAER